MFRQAWTRVLFLLFTVAAVLIVLAAGPTNGQDRGQQATTSEFERIVFVDYGQYFHGGPPPHTATDAATDFRLTLGGISWSAAVVEYSVNTATCSNDCADAQAQVNAALDSWEVSGVTFTMDNASPDANLCGGTNSVSWASIDGVGNVLAVASVCRNVATKVIVGFTVTFDADDVWSDSGDAGKFDIQAVGAHEGGHVVGLDHVSAPRDSRLTLFRTGTTGDAGPRTLGCGDRLGVNALYGTALDCSALPGD